MPSGDESPTAYRFERDYTLEELRRKFKDLRAGEETAAQVRIAGRVTLIRRHGGLIFATMVDHSGSIQLFVDRQTIGPDEHRRFDRLRSGDWLGASGTVIVTRRGELSVKLSSFMVLSRAARPLPAKWSGLRDVETRYRQRYVDLMVNPESRRILGVRTKVISAVRDHLTRLGFLEVETPMLGTIQGGAAARPFLTHHNALDLDMYLRIALELHLKRLIVGNLDRVFE